MSEKNEVCLITGISGMDGYNLTNHLLSLGKTVKGVCRRHSVAENQQYRLENIKQDIEVIYGDVLDKSSIDHAIKTFKPDKIFHLAAQSHVGISSQLKSFTSQVNYLGTLNVLESFAEYVPKSKLYFAASSEMFGSSVDEDNRQRETTNMLPQSPYGISKLAGWHLSRHWRSQGYFVGAGILFNHTHHQRGGNFLCNKVCQAVGKIVNGKQDILELGNLESIRDFGSSLDYVRAMNMILDHNIPDDFVIGTGVSHSIREVVDFCFKHVGLNYNDYVKINPKYLRVEELKYLRADASKAKNILGWIPEYNFEQIFSSMVNYWVNYYKK